MSIQGNSSPNMKFAQLDSIKCKSKVFLKKHASEKKGDYSCICAFLGAFLGFRDK